MALYRPSRKSAPLGVIWIALALVLASVLGAAIGLVWQSSGLEEADEAPVTAETPQG